MDSTDETMNCIDEKIFDFAYELAMRDATMRTTFRGATIYVLLAKDNPDTKYKATDDDKIRADCAKSAVRVYINKIFKNELRTKEEHDKRFKEAAKEVIDAFKGYTDNDSSFSFGNAQKLINMTAKYMFMATYDRPELRDNFKCCHCPMDNQLINKVAKYVGLLVEEYQEITMEYAGELLKGYACKRKQKGDWAKLESFGWSKLKSEKERAIYDTYQETIRFLSSNTTILKERIGVDGPLSPLEFDFYAWGK
jgi:hypothetical protein